MDVPGQVESTERDEAQGTAGRRSFVARTLQALGAIGLLGRFRGRARADRTAPAVAEPESLRTGPLAMRSPERPHQPSFLDALVGREFRGCRVERVSPDHLGGAAVVLRGPEGRFQVDIHARGGDAGVAETEHYALFLANRGNGQQRTHERHGLALMDLAVWLGERERHEARLPVGTFAARQAAHPRGNFLLP